MSQKGSYSHIMLKEIYEQPEAVMRTLQRSSPEAKKLAEAFPLKSFDLIYITGSGTSYHAGLAGQYAMATIAKAFTSVIPSSEFKYWVPRPVGKKSMVFAISQSGESADVLNAATVARENGSVVVAITNTPGSSLTKLANMTLQTHAGEEKAVTATKTYTSELAAMFTIALASAEKHGGSDEETITRLRQTIMEVPMYVQEAISSSDDQVADLAEKLKSNSSIFLLGSGSNYATSLEGALKLKEAAGVFAEGFATREFIHGPMQLISEGTPIIVFMPRSERTEDSMKSIVNFKRMGARVILVTCHGNDRPMGEKSFECVTIRSKVDEIFTPIVYVTPIQLFAYHMAIKRGLNPDKPEKLSKVVRF